MRKVTRNKETPTLTFGDIRPGGMFYCHQWESDMGESTFLKLRGLSTANSALDLTTGELRTFTADCPVMRTGDVTIVDE
jgi:hypothetical protein